jgi:two-component system cell cycle sensor histidine kinase/response regulator CckA
MDQAGETGPLLSAGAVPQSTVNGYPSFEALADFIPQFVWMCTPDGSNVYFNQRWVDYTGLSLEASFGKGWNTPFHPDHKQAAWDAWNHATATGEPYQIESRLRAADGSYRWFLMRGEPLRDATGGVVHWFGSCTDIHDLKLTKEALQQQAALLDLAHDAILVRGAGNEIVFWNRGAEELYGWTRQEALGRSTHELLKTRFPKALAEINAEVEQHSRWQGELIHTRKDGLEITVASRWAAQREQSGLLTSVLEINSDITEHKRAQERLRQAQKLESLGLLAGGVAHDFNNLLVGVIGNTSLALHLLQAGHPASDVLNGVLRSGEQAAHLTRQLLAYSGKGKFLMEALDLSALIPEMAGPIGHSIAKKITVHYALAESLPAVIADRGQVQQVFMNLVLNAADAIGNHDGLITVRTGVEDMDQNYRRLHPETAALPDGRYVCLEVMDTGSGMDEATKAKIFDPFFTTKFVGRGLGLAAVGGIVRGHNAGIVVMSTPGKGSCFTVLLPAAADAVERYPALASNAPCQGSGVVLVVEAEEPVREMAKRALEMFGYTVLVADSRLAAIDLLKTHPGEIALVVLD